MTAASSIVNGVTVHQPVRTARTLRKLVDASSYLILMDADFDSDGKGRALLQGIAPKKLYHLALPHIVPSSRPLGGSCGLGGRHRQFASHGGGSRDL